MQSKSASKCSFLKRVARRFFLLFLSIPLALPNSTLAATPQQAIAGLVKNGGILVSRDGKTIYRLNDNQTFLPASTLKIGTALAAIHILGQDHRFATRFYRSKENDLFIRGLADPFLVSEEIREIARILHTAGIESIRNIYLDDSACLLEGKTDGAEESLNPYDADNGCLAVNFNTVSIAVGRENGVRSDEAQTPWLPIMAELGSGLPPGRHRINITTPENRSLRYAGELFAAMCREQGIKMKGTVAAATTPSDLPLFYEHRSAKSLDEILAALLLYSNNFIANQLFLACGAKQFGWPATWEKGQRAVSAFYQDKLGLNPSQLSQQEGSGLSRRNRITPQAMLSLLDAFKPHAHLLPADQKGALLKSGTMTGVYAYAGYFTAEKGLDSFVLLLNQPENTRDRVLELLRSMKRKM